MSSKISGFWPVILMSSTCLPIMQTSCPLRCLTSISGSAVKLANPKSLQVTCLNFIEKARGASTVPVPGLSQCRHSVHWS